VQLPRWFSSFSFESLDVIVDDETLSTSADGESGTGVDLVAELGAVLAADIPLRSESSWPFSCDLPSPHTDVSTRLNLSSHRLDQAIYQCCAPADDPPITSTKPVAEDAVDSTIVAHIAVEVPKISEEPSNTSKRVIRACTIQDTHTCVCQTCCFAVAGKILNAFILMHVIHSSIAPCSVWNERVYRRTVTCENDVVECAARHTRPTDSSLHLKLFPTRTQTRRPVNLEPLDRIKCTPSDFVGE